MSMKTLSLKDAHKLREADAHGRAEGETNAQNAVIPDGHERRKTGRAHQVLWRATAEDKDLLDRLAKRLSIGQIQPVSYSTTMHMALKALERELKGGK
jgi:hypothetical protein